MNSKNKREQSPQLREYRRNRAYVASIVFLGVAVSIALNQLDASTVVNKLIASWPPLGLLLTLEALVRIPLSTKWYTAWTRVGATVVVAGGAGWLSYWHMVAAVAQHGESYLSAHIFPATVDGLMTVTAVGMVELGARIRALKTADEPRVTPESPVRVAPAPVVQQAQQVVSAEVSRLPMPVSPAPRIAPEVNRTPISRREVRSPLTGRVLTERPPLK